MSKPADNNDLPANKARDPDLAGAEAAMQRAAIKARQRARQSGAGLVIWRDGQVVEVRPELEQ